MSDDLDLEVSHDVASFAAELRRLADALEGDGAYSIQIDGEDVKIPADAALAVTLEREDGETELEFQITWSSMDAENGRPEAEDEETQSA